MIILYKRIFTYLIVLNFFGIFIKDLSAAAAAAEGSVLSCAGTEYSDASPITDTDLERFTSECLRRSKNPTRSSIFENFIRIKGTTTLCESCHYPKANWEEHPKVFCVMLHEEESNLEKLISTKKIDPLLKDYSGNTLLEILIYSHVSDQAIILLLNKLIRMQPFVFSSDDESIDIVARLLKASILTYRLNVFMYLIANIKEDFYKLDCDFYTFLVKIYRDAGKNLGKISVEQDLRERFKHNLNKIQIFFRACTIASSEEELSLFFGRNKTSFLRLPLSDQTQQLTDFLNQSIRFFAERKHREAELDKVFLSKPTQDHSHVAAASATSRTVAADRRDSIIAQNGADVDTDDLRERHDLCGMMVHATEKPLPIETAKSAPAAECTRPTYSLPSRRAHRPVAVEFIAAILEEDKPRAPTAQNNDSPGDAAKDDDSVRATHAGIAFTEAQLPHATGELMIDLARRNKSGGQPSSRRAAYRNFADTESNSTTPEREEMPRFETPAAPAAEDRERSDEAAARHVAVKPKNCCTVM